VREYPDVTRYRAELATARIHLSRILLALGRQPEATQAQDTAITEYERLMLANPHDYRTNLASVMLTLMPGAEVAPSSVRQPASTFFPSMKPPQAAGPGEETREDTPAPRALPPELLAEQRARLTLIRAVAGSGGSTIYLADDHDLNRQVAVKLLRFADQPDIRRRFLKEAQITAQLEHPNIIPIYGLGYRSEDEAPFLIMRLIRGQTLGQASEAYHAARRHGKHDVRDLRRLVQAFAAACRGVAFAHSRGVIHRDPKPDNILLSEAGEVVVVDWGLAKVMGQAAEEEAVRIAQWADPGATQEGAIMGTPSYMAPEMASGQTERVDTRTDVYMLGATLYEVLTGRPPYRGDSVLETLDHIRKGAAPRTRAVNPSVPPALDGICAQAMAHDPADRYATASELHLDVMAWLDGRQVSVYRQHPLVRLANSLRHGWRSR
jgi:serine/threonine protein kinase